MQRFKTRALGHNNAEKLRLAAGRERRDHSIEFRGYFRDHLVQKGPDRSAARRGVGRFNKNFTKLHGRRHDEKPSLARRVYLV